MIKKIFFVFLFISLVITNSFATPGTTLGDDSSTPTGIDYTVTNKNDNRTALERSLCILITMICGRIGRVIAIFAITTFGFLFLLGKIEFTKLIHLAIGFSLLFAPAMIAVVLLPSKTKYYDPTQPKDKQYRTVTVAYMIKKSCPALKF